MTDGTSSNVRRIEVNKQVAIINPGQRKVQALVLDEPERWDPLPSSRGPTGAARAVQARQGVVVGAQLPHAVPRGGPASDDRHGLEAQPGGGMRASLWARTHPTPRGEPTKKNRVGDMQFFF